MATIEHGLIRNNAGQFPLIKQILLFVNTNGTFVKDTTQTPVFTGNIAYICSRKFKNKHHVIHRDRIRNILSCSWSCLHYRIGKQ